MPRREASRIVRRPGDERGATELGWLHSRHSFSFGEYYHPRHMGFRSLRVINDDVVEPGKGFGMHSHRDAEIFSYVIEGRLRHKDSMGNGSVIEAGGLQYMSAGSGVTHSEFNDSSTERVHFLQIWVLPGIRGAEPRYAERTPADLARPDALTLVFSPDGREGAIPILQEADIFFGRLRAEASLEHVPGRDASYVHVIRGGLQVAGETLKEGDGAEIERAEALEFTATADSEFFLFELS